MMVELVVIDALVDGKGFAAWNRVQRVGHAVEVIVAFVVVPGEG